MSYDELRNKFKVHYDFITIKHDDKLECMHT